MVEIKEVPIEAPEELPDEAKIGWIWNNTGYAQTTVFVTTSYKNIFNTAPISWITPISLKKIAISVLKQEDTCKNIEDTGEFTISIPKENKLKELLATAEKIPRNQSEIEKAGLKTVASKYVKPPLIDGCRAYLECQTEKGIDVGVSKLFIAEVKAAYIAKGEEGNLDQILYYGGTEYTNVGPKKELYGTKQ